MMNDKTYNAAVFVIPNAAGYCRQFWLKSVGERVEKYSKDLCSQKGIEFDPEHDKVVQVWFTSKYNEDLKNDYLKEDNLGSGDMSSHGFRMDGKFYYFKYSYLPYPLIKDVKEGDTMDLEFEVSTVDEDDNRTYETIKLHITFDQHSYRYRNFGNFEDVVRRVVTK